jgi:hypothetical protein
MLLRLPSKKHEKSSLLFCKEEVWAMLQNAKLLKHRIDCLFYGWWISAAWKFEVYGCKIGVFDRKQLFPLKGKAPCSTGTLASVNQNYIEADEGFTKRTKTFDNFFSR